MLTIKIHDPARVQLDEILQLIPPDSVAVREVVKLRQGQGSGRAVKCLHCGHVWTPRVKKPKYCPKCISPNWDKPPQR